MEVIAVAAVLLCLIGGVIWLISASKQEGKVNERERQQRKALDDAELANQVRRDITRRDAIERLRNSKYNTDMPDLSANNVQRQRSTDDE